MLLVTLQILLLLSVIITPLRLPKAKAETKFKIDTNTENAIYAINENGMLERIQRPSLTNH
jgi:hypothetical protein